jgi:hypothetical protein
LSTGPGETTIGKTIFTYVYIKKKPSPEPAGQLQSNLAVGTNISCMIGIQVYSNEGPSPPQRGIITKVKK